MKKSDWTMSVYLFTAAPLLDSYLKKCFFFFVLHGLLIKLSM